MFPVDHIRRSFHGFCAYVVGCSLSIKCLSKHIKTTSQLFAIASGSTTLDIAEFINHTWSEWLKWLHFGQLQYGVCWWHFCKDPRFFSSLSLLELDLVMRCSQLAFFLVFTTTNLIVGIWMHLVLNAPYGQTLMFVINACQPSSTVLPTVGNNNKTLSRVIDQDWFTIINHIIDIFWAAWVLLIRIIYRHEPSLLATINRHQSWLTIINHWASWTIINTLLSIINHH